VENAAPNSPYDAEQPSISDPGWTLRRRLLLIITIALLPVVGVSIFQGVERVKRDTEDVRAQLIQSARATAANQQEVLNAGEQILRAMGSLQDVRDMSGNCDGILADAMIGVSYFTNLSRIDANGTFVCSAVPLAKGNNIEDGRVRPDQGRQGRGGGHAHHQPGIGPSGGGHAAAAAESGRQFRRQPGDHLGRAMVQLSAQGPSFAQRRGGGGL